MDLDLPERLVLSPGQTFTAELPGLGGAGYLWFAQVCTDSAGTGAEVRSDDAVVAVAIERGGDRQPSAAAERPRVGASLPETLRVTAHAPGTAMLHVVQRRPWESGSPRVERHTQVVVVSPATDTRKTLDEHPPSEDTQPERDH